MKTISKAYDDPRQDRINRYNERVLERLQILHQRGYRIQNPGPLWCILTLAARPLVRKGWLTAAQVYYPYVKRIRVKEPRKHN